MWSFYPSWGTVQNLHHLNLSQIHVPPTIESLAVLQEAEAFPGNEPEGKFVEYLNTAIDCWAFGLINSTIFYFLSVYYPDLPLLKQEDAHKDAEAGGSNVTDKGQLKEELSGIQTQSSTESPEGIADKVGNFMCYSNGYIVICTAFL